MIRTFVAVDLTPAVRKRAGKLVGLLRPASADVNWVDPPNMHLTLKFLGDVPDTQVPAICNAVAAAAAEVEPFSLQVHGCGAFPTPSRPRTIWIGVTDGLEPIRQLHQAIDFALLDLGFAKERRQFTPHLTIGRVRRGGPALGDLADLVQKYVDFQAGQVDVSQVIVFASYREKTGPTYDVLGRGPLGGSS